MVGVLRYGIHYEKKFPLISSTNDPRWRENIKQGIETNNVKTIFIHN